MSLALRFASGYSFVVRRLLQQHNLRTGVKWLSSEQIEGKKVTETTITPLQLAAASTHPLATIRQNQKVTTEMMQRNVQGYAFTRHVYIKNYDKIVEQFVSAVKAYRVFFGGVKDIYNDIKRYMKISRIAHRRAEGLKALNRKELELYMQMPRDIVKVAPVLIFSALPMVGYAVFPLIFMYPQKFLTTHFWSLQQRTQFQQLQLQERLSCNSAVFQFLKTNLNAVRQHKNHAELVSILDLLGRGIHPTVETLLKVRDIFAKPPYSLSSLNKKYIKLLCQMHGVPGNWFKRYRLTEHAFLVHYMDLAIRREGDVHNMHTDAMCHACYIRGLNPTNLSTEEMIVWLRNWMKVSTSLKEEHISLFLHLPVFLGYKHPNNL